MIKYHKSLMKFSQFVDIFMHSKNVSLERSTLAGYNSYLKMHLLPFFGDHRIGFISPALAQEFIEYLVDLNLSPKTVKNIFSVFRTIMERAYKWQYIKDNPCNYVDLPPLKSKEADYYTEKEFFKLMEALDKLPESELKYKVAIEFAVLCGLRKSEICGLDWKNIDLEKGTFKVSQKRIIVVGEGVITGKPKTKKSNRVGAIPEPLLSDLKLLYKQCNSSAVICGDNLEPIYPQVLSRWFTRFLDKNKLRHIGLHTLRHTYASILATLDIDIKSASEQLGHAQTSTTMNTYAHVFRDIRRDIAEKIGAMIAKKV